MSYVTETKEMASLFDIQFIRESDQAILIRFDGEDIWVPKSQILVKGHDWLNIPLWLAKDKGLC